MLATSLQVDERAVGVLEDDVVELLGVFQTAERGHGVLEHLAVRRRRLADLAGRHLDVLLL